MEAANSPTALEGEKPAPPGPVRWASAEFEAIYQEHSRAVYYTALRLLGDATAAEDAAHDVFLKAFRKIGEFRGQSAWRTWLYRITINHCLNLRQSWHSRHIVGGADESVLEGASTGRNPLQMLETKELGGRIQKALEAIPEEYRLILLLVADENLSYEEVGALTGQSEDAVRGKLYRARKAFEHQFGKTA